MTIYDINGNEITSEEYAIPLTQNGNRYSIDPNFGFSWDNLRSAVAEGIPVYCFNKTYSSSSLRYMLTSFNGSEAIFSYLRYETYQYSNDSFTIMYDGTVTYDSTAPDTTLTTPCTPADAYAVGQRFEEMGKGFVRLAETVLTEDAVEIVWTQTQDGKPLSDYKDFFIYWTGKFTADVGANNATNSRFQCRGNGGIMYFSCQFPKKISTENYAGWVSIEEITNDGNFAIWKSQFPNAFLLTANGANIDYRVQGLPEACQTTVTDICCMTNPAQTTLQKLHLGNMAGSTSIFAAGTKAVLYGRAR